MARKTFLGMTGNAGLGVLRKPASLRSPNSRYRKVNNVPMHRLIVEQRTGLKLKPQHVVHHVDPTDKITNEGHFVVCEDAAYHSLIEARTRAYNACGHAGWKKCRFCGEWDDPENMLEKEWINKGKKVPRWDHYQFRYKCISKAEWESKKGENYQGFARTEGIWKAVGPHEVECVICAMRMKASALPKATHAKLHHRRGEAVGRTEPAVNPKSKLKTRTVYYPTAITARPISTTLSERGDGLP